MAGLGNAKETAVLNAFFKGQNITAETGLWVCAHTGDPGDDGTANEVSGNNYARVSCAADANTSAGNWTALDNGGPSGQRRVRNNVDITFPQASGSWGTITHWSIKNVASAGDATNIVAMGTLTGSVAIGASNTLQFPALSLEFYID